MNRFLFLISQRIPRWPSTPALWSGLALVMAMFVAAQPAYAMPLIPSYQVRIPGPGGEAIGGGGGGATPSFVRAVNSSSTTTNATGVTVNSCASHSFCHPMYPALAGNTWVFFVQYASSPATVLTPTNGGDTCAIINTTAAVNSKLLAAGYCKNLTAGRTQLNIAFSVDVAGISVSAEEDSNIDPSSPVDTSSVATNAGSTTAAAGSLTPGASNKFLVQGVLRTQTPVSASCGHSASDTQCFTAGSQSNITWVLHSTDTIDGIAMQDGVYASGAAITPQMTMAASSGYASVAVSFNTATSGSSRGSGVQVAGITHLNQKSSASPASVIHAQVRTEGNFIGVSSGFGGAAYTITGVTDSAGCSYTHTSLGQLGDGNSGKSDLWWCANSTPSAARLIDIGVTGTPSDYSMLIYDVAGLAAAPFTGNSYGNFKGSIPSSSTYSMFETIPVPPGFDSGFAMGNIQVADNTCQAINAPAAGTFDGEFYGGEDISGDGTNPPGENNCWFSYVFSSGVTSLYTLGFANTTALSSAAGQVAFFKGATANASNIADDNFTRANVNPLRTSNQVIYTPQAGDSGFQVLSNLAQPNAQSFDDGVLYIGTSITSSVAFSNDQYATCTLSTLTGTGTENGIGLFLRGSISVNTGYRIIINATNGVNTWISRFTTGTDVVINGSGSGQNSGFVWGTGGHTTVYAEIVGSTILVKDGQSGATVASATDANIASGAPGMAFSSTMTASGCSRFTAGNK